MLDKNELLNIIDKNAPISVDDLAKLVFGDGEFEEQFFKMLTTFEKDCEIIYTKKNKITTPLKAGYILGKYKLIANKALIVTDNNEIEVMEGKSAGALPNDIVLAQNSKGKAMIFKIVERSNTEYYGVLKPIGNKFLFEGYKVKLPSPLIFLKKDIGDAKPFDKVRVMVTGTTKGGEIRGKITKNYGNSNENNANYRAILDMYGIADDFPDIVLKQASEVAFIDDSQFQERVDLREKLIITIDPHDALDLDDAISLEQTENGFCLGVHIADVSHYVREGTELDNEALSRATSVYFTDKVVPMLPKQLSNGICSLSENEDRLCLSVFMDIDQNGVMQNYKIKKSVINNKKKCSYRDVNKILDGTADDTLKAEYTQLLDILPQMNNLAKKLTKLRFKRGALDFAESECKINLDKNGEVTDIIPYKRGDSQRMIEEFMLYANEVTASFVFWQNIPFIYRVHNEPEREKVDSLFKIAKGLGYTYKGKQVTTQSMSLQKLISYFENTQYNHIISTLALRSMCRANYSISCIGHFGLCLERYCHFTSPIRRYPDLACHRIIKEILDGKLSEKRVEYYEKFTDYAAKQSTKMEISATNAERAIEDMYKALYMSKFIGQQYKAVISSVTGFGFFAELPNTIEGLVPISSLGDDYYNFSPESLTLKGERHKKTYSIGDEVEVICNGVNIAAGQIEFNVI